MLLGGDEFRLNGTGRDGAETDGLGVTASLAGALGVVAGSTDAGKIHDIASEALVEEVEQPSWVIVWLVVPDLTNSIVSVISR